VGSPSRRQAIYAPLGRDSWTGSAQGAVVPLAVTLGLPPPEYLLDGVGRELLEAALRLPVQVRLALLKFLKVMTMSADTIVVLQGHSRRSYPRKSYG
jgi:hypothetical protein